MTKEVTDETGTRWRKTVVLVVGILTCIVGIIQTAYGPLTLCGGVILVAIAVYE